MTPTDQYIHVLTRLKLGDLGLLRANAGKRLDESVRGFDLFAGLWWPLRQRNERVPRREVAWLIAKLYAFRPIPHSAGTYLALQLGRSQPIEPRAQQKYRQAFDRMLALPVNQIEPALQWALGRVASTRDFGLDWVNLTDELSIWERETTRLKWATAFLRINERA